MPNEEVTTNEIMEFLQENMVMRDEFTGLRKEMKQMEHRMLDHIDDKLADLEGSTIARQRKQDNKVNKILELLERHNLAPADEIKSIRGIHIFPVLPKM